METQHLILVRVCGYQRQRCSSMSATLGGGGGGGGGGADQENDGCKALEDIQSIAGNQQCCDCGESGPDWASINLGITLCIVCSGIHRLVCHTHKNTHTYTQRACSLMLVLSNRSLGVHFSKVRSLTLDSWEPELIKVI